jgi:hypothetical protein
MNLAWIFEQSALGRVLIAPSLPDNAALFYTTADFDGRISAEAAERLRAFMRDRFSIDARLATCGQVHGIRVEQIKAARESWCEFGGCDALFTDERNVALGIKVADCLPVTVLDSGHSVAANIHSGWRGAASNIVAHTLETMRRGIRFDPSRSSAWLGPSIRACCFEVGEEVIAQLELTRRPVEPHVDRARGRRPFVDLPALAREVLTGAGIPSERVFDSGICTRCGEGFHSYRRDRGVSGRNLAIVVQ